MSGWVRGCVCVCSCVFVCGRFVCLCEMHYTNTTAILYCIIFKKNTFVYHLVFSYLLLFND